MIIMKILTKHTTMFVVATMATLGGCGGSAPKTESKPAVAAKVEGAVKEPELARIRLSPEAEQRLGIALAAVELLNVSRTQQLAGETLAASGREWSASAPFAGTVVAPEGGIPAAGSGLRKGQTVVRLLPLASAGDGKIEADREAASAEARLEAARARLNRTQQLLADRAGSVRNVEEAREQAKLAEAEATAARARLERARANATDAVGGLMVAATQDAILQKMLVTNGQTVPAGAMLFEAAAITPLWVRVPAYAGLTSSLSRGASARVQKLGSSPGRSVEARPVAAPVSGDPAAATVDLFFEFANADAVFRPNERVSVTLPLTGEEKVLVVPWAAVLFDIHGGAWVYESTAEHTYMRRRVDVRYVTGSFAVLARGPAVGAKIVTTGAAELFGTEFSTGK